MQISAFGVRRPPPTLRPACGARAIAVFFLAVASPLQGQVADGKGPFEPTVGAASSEGVPGARPTARPARTAEPPVIDGHLEDPAWLTAVELTGFSQQRPLDGAPPTEVTTVKVAYDSDHMYFAFDVHYSDPSVMRHSRADRDRIQQDDLITVYFDTFLDGQRVYEFDVNGYNVQGDGILGVNSPGGSSAAIPRSDRSWDAIWYSGAEMLVDGFTAEIAIPYKSMRFPSHAPGEPHRWGFQMVREIKGKNNEQIVWSPMTRSESNFFVQMGFIEGMTDLGTNRNLEILPQFTAVQVGAIDPERAEFVNDDAHPEVGVNVKYGVTSNLTADFTVNPDFSQVETDQPQIEVNRRFPLFFAELRPFFVEGAEIFSISGPVTFVHTRTIVDPMVGAKLTGKIGPFAVGVVATDDRAPGNVDDPDDPAKDESAKTFIARARYDLYTQSTLGAVFTDREFLDSHSRLAAVDANFRLNSVWSTSFRVVGSWNRDLGGVDQDGHMLDARIGRNGRSVGATLSAYEISPEFDTQVGFVRRQDERVVAGDFSYAFWPESWVLTWGPQVAYERNWTFDGVLQDKSLSGALDFEFSRNINLGMRVTQAMERYREIDFDKNTFSMSTGAALDAAARVSVSGNFSMGDEVRRVEAPFVGDVVNWSLGTRLRPIPRLDYSLNIRSSRLTDPRNNDEEIFDVTIVRGTGTFQVTDRLATRNITEYDTSAKTLVFNILFTYRVNAGTVVYAGYNDRYQRGSFIEGPTDEPLFSTDDLRRTNRAVFVKVQYLLRY